MQKKNNWATWAVKRIYWIRVLQFWGLDFSRFGLWHLGGLGPSLCDATLYPRPCMSLSKAKAAMNSSSDCSVQRQVQVGPPNLLKGWTLKHKPYTERLHTSLEQRRIAGDRPEPVFWYIEKFRHCDRCTSFFNFARGCDGKVL